MDSVKFYDQCMQRPELAKAGEGHFGREIKVLVKTDSLGNAGIQKFVNGWLQKEEKNKDVYNIPRSSANNLQMTPNLEFQNTADKHLVGQINTPVATNVATDSKTATVLQFGKHQKLDAENWQVNLPDGYRLSDGLKERGAPLRLYLQHTSGEIGHFVLLSEQQAQLWRAAIEELSDKLNGGKDEQKSFSSPRSRSGSLGSVPSGKINGVRGRSASIGATVKNETPIRPLDPLLEQNPENKVGNSPRPEDERAPEPAKRNFLLLALAVFALGAIGMAWRTGHLATAKLWVQSKIR